MSTRELAHLSDDYALVLRLLRRVVLVGARASGSVSAHESEIRNRRCPRRPRECVSLIFSLVLLRAGGQRASNYPSGKFSRAAMHGTRKILEASKKSGPSEQYCGINNPLKIRKQWLKGSDEWRSEVKSFGVSLQSCRSGLAAAQLNIRSRAAALFRRVILNLPKAVAQVVGCRLSTPVEMKSRPPPLITKQVQNLNAKRNRLRLRRGQDSPLLN